MKRNCQPPPIQPPHPPHHFTVQPAAPHIHLLYIFGMRPYIASDNVILQRRLELLTVFYKDGWLCQYATAG